MILCRQDILSVIMILYYHNIWYGNIVQLQLSNAFSTYLCEGYYLNGVLLDLVEDLSMNF